MHFEPSRQEVLAARGKSVSDVIAPGLRILFCGINPGLYTAAVGHHFARPGNRFWPALHRAGLILRPLSPFEERELLDHGYGITNVVERATASAAELSAEEIVRGGSRLEKKVLEYRPCILAILGLGAYRTAFGRPGAVPGPQNESLGGARVWVLPNPSGINANYRMEVLGENVERIEELRGGGVLSRVGGQQPLVPKLQFPLVPSLQLPLVPKLQLPLVPKLQLGDRLPEAPASTPGKSRVSRCDRTLVLFRCPELRRVPEGFIEVLTAWRTWTRSWSFGQGPPKPELGSQRTWGVVKCRSLGASGLGGS